MALNKALTKARVPRGLTDKTAEEIYATEAMAAIIRNVYETYGFEPVETPLIEYTDILGKFLPDKERPNSGVFSFPDDDEQWLSLRYDLTAPLARYVAENFEQLPKPYRSYRMGWVFRNEKPGPGRFRQFLQYDADIVGADNPAADAEICMMAADILERLGIPRGDYQLSINNRKLLDAIIESIGLTDVAHQEQRLTVLRALDKLDKFGPDGVALLLGKGRLDESGDFTKGAELPERSIQFLLDFITNSSNSASPIDNLHQMIGHSPKGIEALTELEQIQNLLNAAGYAECFKITPTIVRGLEYYTGPVFEAELLFDIINEAGQNIIFGSVGGGGRYNNLVSRFRANPVPATGFSIGVSRLMTALKNLQRLNVPSHKGPVVVLVLDRDQQALAHYQHMVALLRQNSIRAEMYIGDSGIKAQMKYADRRGAPCVIIQGETERQTGTIEIKDLVEGARLSQQIADNHLWRQQSPAQINVKEDQMIQEVQKILKKHEGNHQDK